jgi:hypothetical protein
MALREALVPSGWRAALALAAGEIERARRLPPEPHLARRSLIALPLAYPLFLLQRLADAATGAAAPLTLANGLRDAGVFVIGWAGFALLSRRLAQALGREALWPRYLVLWNWCNFIQYVLLLAGTLPALLGLPPMVGETAALVSFFWAIWVEWLATRVGLALSPLPAALITLLDLLFGFILASAAGLLG